MKPNHFIFKTRGSRAWRPRPRGAGERGYILLTVLLTATMMLIALSAETQRTGQQIKREREEELIHRGNQYVRAVKRFYKKFGRYPASIEQLEDTNHYRSLRRRYKDPITGNDDWRLIHAGEAKVVLRGFGKGGGQVGPAGGPAAPGSPTGSTGFGGLESSSQTFGNNSGFGSPAQNNPGQSNPDTAVGGAMGGAGASPTSGGLSSGSAVGPGIGIPASELSTGIKGKAFGGGPIVGVASSSTKESIKELNGKNHYNDWEFVYDPRFDTQRGIGIVPNGPVLNPAQPLPAPGQPLPSPGVAPLQMPK